MIITITGPNDFLRKAELRKLVDDFIVEHGDMAVERLDGEEASTDRMAEAAASLPFLTSKKMVILYDPSKQKSFAEKIDKILEGVAETTDLIINELKLDKRLSYYKTLKKATDFREFNGLDAAGLALWAVGYAKERGAELSRANAQFLVERVGPVQQLLASEIDKLAAYDAEISKKNIETLTEPTPSSTIFGLLDAAFAGNLAKTSELYSEQRTLKVEPQQIIAMLAWQLNILALVKTAGTRGADEIAQGARLNPFVVRKSQGLARNLTLSRLKEMIKDLLDLDVRLKTSAVDPDEVLQLYFVKLS